MSQPARILVALILGISFGILSTHLASPQFAAGAIAVADPIGTLWLDALRMTIVPLVVSLLITGIATGAEAARAGRLTLRAVILFVAILWTSSILGTFLLPLFVTFWPLPSAGAEALREAMGGATVVGPVPALAEFLGSIVPTNPVAAAAGDAILPLILFTTVFAFAITRIAKEPRERLTAFFSAIADAMLVIIGWVLWIGPVGVFALAFALGARSGAQSATALFHYIIAVTSVGTVVFLAAYPLARFGGRVPLTRFARAILPAQAVALSTQSSLATLPAMLASTERLGIPVRSAGVVLPLAVAIFRATGPAMNVAVALYIAHWLGIHLGPAQIAAGVVTAAITTMGAVSLPGQVSFITSIAPICIAMGLPVAPLGLLIAVEPIPDLMRTLGNVTMDIAATTTVARSPKTSDRTSDPTA